MSERIEGSAYAAVSRACGWIALGIGVAMNGFRSDPVLAVKAGGILALIATCALLLRGYSAERACFTTTRIWQELQGHERPSTERAQTVIGGARRRACETYAYLFALGSLALFVIALAGEAMLAFGDRF